MGPVRSDGWRVVVLDDDVNTLTTAGYALAAHCGLDAEGAAWRLHTEGSVPVAEFADRDPAEELVVRLQRHGLHAALRPAG
ncbi:ATP-dependent Clp protease adaptor ClpS [Actinosynnema mirum]|uniref:ATP-dependent Clp protease adaptor protein ClpS n=1 Tax=Actinosynnema mirum (strain ATCC 29888 / DSM 43827 / JCM 3225 / NBRC 14064 / NCIMB 13271 / NRRL B-12336 / IMRU 3971 / 101) TaxID=446462 RepID=C6WMJ9_ACTMD|nr:ATP-dependent Clp protease adaptor ClpS [Actinosynnema mirum]ACU36528.1 ATP-dependent Clp protease adaptor protein ClpS [Actinosynnema mirum DSM 43827]